MKYTWWCQNDFNVQGYISRADLTASSPQVVAGSKFLTHDHVRGLHRLLPVYNQVNIAISHRR
jgi:hypothetical protein